MLFDQCTNDVTGEQDKVCQWLYERTGAGWLADGGYYLLLQPSRVVLILVIAIVARAVLNHFINRIVARTGEGKVPAFLRPLREKMPTVGQSTALFPERRR